MTEKSEHPYPSKYPPGKHWAIDAAWEILDQLPVGLLSSEQRAWIAGQIAGHLMREREEGEPPEPGNLTISEIIREFIPSLTGEWRVKAVQATLELFAARLQREWNAPHEWTCGHVAGAMCAECWRVLAAKAHELAEENLRLKE